MRRMIRLEKASRGGGWFEKGVKRGAVSKVKVLVLSERYLSKDFVGTAFSNEFIERFCQSRTVEGAITMSSD